MYISHSVWSNASQYTVYNHMLNGPEKHSEPKDYVLMSLEGLALITV